MIQERLLLAEGFINIASGIGLYVYLVTILLNRTRSLLERRLGILLAIVGTLFITRGFNYAVVGTDSLSSMSLFLSSLFPIVALLFVEGLLRQHSPLPLKVFAFIGTWILGPWALFFKTSSSFFVVLLIFQGIVMASLSFIIFTRKKASLSESENRLVNGVSIACAGALPLLVTDFRHVFGWEIMRLGALGGLLFCLSTLKFSDKNGKRDLAREFAHIIFTDLLGTLLFCLIWNDFSYFWIAYVTFMTMHLLILLLKEFTLRQDPKVQEWLFNVMEAIGKNQINSVPEMHHLLVSELGSQSLIFLDEKSLHSYNLDLISNYLSDKNELSLNALRADPSNEATQQLIYALESHQMNQIFVITSSPLLLVLANTPLVKGGVAYRREIKILKAIICLLQRKERYGQI